MKFHGAQCASEIYLLFDSHNQSVHFYRTDTVHTHDDGENVESAVKKISGEIETEIRAAFKNQRP